MQTRFIGIDVGAETIKVVELLDGEHGPRCGRRLLRAHDKAPGPALIAMLDELGWDDVAGAQVTGRLARRVNLPRVPIKNAMAAGFRFRADDRPATLVSIGNHGFSVLELRERGGEVMRENGRCSQGTGNFLRQLVERFDLTVEEAATLCEDVADPAPLSGRCPVILKTDMTHLANQGESRARILAGLYDAVCENVQVLIKPRVSPSRVVLLGGVQSSRRVHEQFRRFVAEHGMELHTLDGDDARYLEAFGCALAAAARPAWVPPLDKLVLPPAESRLDRLPPLAASLGLVTRMRAPAPDPTAAAGRDLVLGFDIGSTGSKLVATDHETGTVLWEDYLRTGGSPVGAAQSLMQRFVDSPAGAGQLRMIGVTGSGREIVGSLMTTCWGPAPVFVLNEIAAHAEGARHFDARVDTIFEIGGQDAKYIRLADGRVVDAAMNEACSAGTGSFIEEQGKKLADVRDVVELGERAMDADGGVSLGQHCSVFMAEIIDEAVAGGVPQSEIVAGIYDSIVQNYLNRVKGSRTVGEVVFCQGMPFAADALATAVARRTGRPVIVPPNPGTVGALGIALLARGHAETALEPLDPRRFLAARVDKKDTFVCKSTVGCGGAGNKCTIDRIAVDLAGTRQKFTWGGGCSLFDKGTRRRKLPDRAPDPFRERGEVVAEMLGRLPPRGRPVAAIADGFQTKAMLPFFATFLWELGYDIKVFEGGDQATLKRGIEEANVPACAPMQLFHGLAGAMADARPDLLFVPMLREVARQRGEQNAVLCPIVQGSPEILKLDLGHRPGMRMVSPVIDIGMAGLESAELLDSCRKLAAELGARDERWRLAHRSAVMAQRRFEDRLAAIGRAALEFAGEHGVVPVVVLGRPYTIHDTVLNSNVPALLREQGALAIPVDCYSVDDEVPVFEDVFWAYGQRNLRAAHQVRRTPGQYAVWCSNYSCGPDSFNLHFFAYLMDGKPFAVIETDGHSGDAGTKTRLEAFLHCVHQDLASQRVRPPRALHVLGAERASLKDIRARGERLLLPRMGPGAEVLAASFRGLGLPAECLPLPDRTCVEVGRRHTSGKECVPMAITTGSLLTRLEQAGPDEKFAFFMPSATGPCRFGVYNLLHKIILERQGWKDRVRIWSPSSGNYISGVPSGYAALAFTTLTTADLLIDMLHHTRPVETRPGAASEIWTRAHAELIALAERAAAGDLSLPAALMEVARGRLFGTVDLLRRTAAAMAAVTGTRPLPTVLVVGEIYVRLDPFANDFVIERLEQRGLRAKLAPFNEWIEYLDHVNLREGRRAGFGAHVGNLVRARIQSATYAAAGTPLGWAPRTSVDDTLRAASSYLREDLIGEAVLTLGGPLHEWRAGHIDAVVSVGPHECMPNKIAEAQFFHAAEREGLLSLTVPLNGDPIDPEVLDNFAFEVHARYREPAARRQPVLRNRRSRRVGGRPEALA